MTLRLLKTASLIALVCAPAMLFAQAEISGKEEERLEALARSQGEFVAPKSKISVGFRILSSGGRVDFKNLGIIPARLEVVPASDGVVQRVYDNGAVAVDTLRTDEKDVDGNQISTPGGRYKVYTTTSNTIVDSSGNAIGTETVTTQSGDFLSYTPGLTRQWSAASEVQIGQPGYVGFSIFSATSDGGSTSHKQGATGGVEFQLTKDLGRGSRRFHWSMLTGISLNDINSKSAGTVASTLHTYTDYYSYNFNGQVVSLANVTNPSYGPLFDTNGIFINSNGTETTVPLNAVPDAAKSTTTDLIGGASVTGQWQVKGAYFMVKFGPSLRTQLTTHLNLTASLGVAGAYAGTRYSATESFSVPSLPELVLSTTDPDDGSNIVSTTTAKFVSGYYADVNLEWSTNDTLGLFTGFTTQKLSSYDQKLGDRVAKVDLGSSVGIRGGVSIKF
jgi:hypothetical protein